MTKVKKPYAIKRAVTGLGLFAVEDIPAGKRIIEYVGHLITNEEVEKKRGKYFFGVNTKWSIDGRSRSNTARYINHSCRPNAEAFISGHRIWIWSKRGIRAGEEITIHYGKEYFDDHIKPIGCKCEPCRNKAQPKR
jgi:SET domain-containing protein